jgi:hypothetical protein
LSVQALAAIFLASLVAVGMLSTAAPVQQKQSVLSSLLIWSDAVDNHIGLSASACETAPSNQTHLTLSGLELGFVNFGLNWSFDGTTGKTRVVVAGGSSNHPTISPARAQGIISSIALSVRSVGTVLEFDHRSLATQSLAADPLYIPLLIYHKKQGGYC